MWKPGVWVKIDGNATESGSSETGGPNKYYSYFY